MRPVGAQFAWTEPPEHGLTGPRDWGLCSGTGPHAPAGLKRDPTELAGQQLQRQLLCQLLMQHQSDAALWAAVVPWATAKWNFISKCKVISDDEQRWQGPYS